MKPKKHPLTPSSSSSFHSSPLHSLSSSSSHPWHPVLALLRLRLVIVDRLVHLYRDRAGQSHAAFTRCKSLNLLLSLCPITP